MLVGDMNVEEMRSRKMKKGELQKESRKISRMINMFSILIVM
jgi:hypothetical protein